MLEVQAANKGILIPRVALTGTADAATVPLPATSLLVYNTTTAGVSPNNVIPGYYYNSGIPAAPVWKRFATGNGDAWLTTGNAGTNAAANFIGTTDNIDWVIKTNNTERVRVLANGKVGINTAAPGYNFVIGGTLGVFGIDNTAYFCAKNSGGTYENYLIPRWSDDIMYLSYGAGGFNIRNSSNVNTMFMTNANSVGIGTVTPATSSVGGTGVALLNVKSTSQPAGGWYPVEIVNTTNTNACIGMAETNTSSGFTAAEGITYYTGTSNMPAGIMGLAINTTGTGVGVNATTNSQNTSSYGLYAQCPYLNTAGYYAGVFVGRVLTTGNYYTTSDGRLKKNITPINNGLEKILKLQPVEYDFNEKYSDFVASSERQAGFIAQDVEKVFPGSSIVSSATLTSFGKNIKANAERNVKTFEAKVIAYTGFVPYMVEAIKEQQTMIEEQKKAIEELKKLNEDQEKRIKTLEEKK